MKSKNDLLSEFISGYIHLSKKDYAFFSNLQTIIKDTNKITSNQAKLFDKLITKYQRQLKKQNCDIDKLLNLDWVNEVVESKQEYLQAKLSFINGDLIIKAPFNTNFVQNFRKIIHNEFKWNALLKHYTAPFTTYNLKLALTCVKQYYKEFVLCEELTKIYDNISQYHAEFYNPTLVRKNDNFYIAAINESLHRSISHIVQLDDDPKTLFELSQYGIEIDKSIVSEDPLRNFASSPKVTFDIEDLDKIVEMLHLLNVDSVFTTRGLVYNKDVNKEIKTKLLDKGITCTPSNPNDSNYGIFIVSNSSFYSVPQTATKIIHLKNSRPVKIK